MTQQEKAQEAINYARFKQQQLAKKKAERAQELGNNLDAPRVANRPRTPRTQTGKAVSGLAGALSNAVKNKARSLNPVPRVVNTARGVDRSIADKINSLTSPDTVPQGPRKLTKVSTPKGKLRKTQAQVDAEARALKQSRFDKLNIAPRKGTSLKINRSSAKPTSVAKPGFDDLVSDAKAGPVVGVRDPGTGEIYYSSGGNPVDSKGNYVFPYDEDFEIERANAMYDDFPGGEEPPTNKLPDDSIRQRANKASKFLKMGSKLPGIGLPLSGLAYMGATNNAEASQGSRRYGLDNPEVAGLLSDELSSGVAGGLFGALGGPAGVLGAVAGPEMADELRGSMDTPSAMKTRDVDFAYPNMGSRESFLRSMDPQPIDQQDRIKGFFNMGY